MEERFKQILLNKYNKAIKEADKLYQEQKYDESIFEKIKANVYDIFYKIIDPISKTKDFKNNYYQKLNDIPKNWTESLSLAIKNNDFEQEFLEKLKLKTKDEIINIFKRVYGDLDE